MQFNELFTLKFHLQNHHRLHLDRVIKFYLGASKKHQFPIKNAEISTAFLLGDLLEFPFDKWANDKNHQPLKFVGSMEIKKTKMAYLTKNEGKIAYWDAWVGCFAFLLPNDLKQAINDCIKKHYEKDMDYWHKFLLELLPDKNFITSFFDAMDWEENTTAQQQAKTLGDFYTKWTSVLRVCERDKNKPLSKDSEALVLKQRFLSCFFSTLHSEEEWDTNDMDSDDADVHDEEFTKTKFLTALTPHNLFGIQKFVDELPERLNTFEEISVHGLYRSDPELFIPCNDIMKYLAMNEWQKRGQFRYVHTDENNMILPLLDNPNCLAEIKALIRQYYTFG